jgi:putative ABC transport system permease protein
MTALRVSPERLRDSLTDGQRTVAGGRSERVRQTLVVAQVALTIVLLAGAGLLARSFVRVLSIDPGYRTDNALILDLIGSFSRGSDERARRMQMQHELLGALSALPGVEQAGLISAFPLGAGNFPDGRFLEMTRPDEIKSFDDVVKLGDQAKVRAGQAAYRIASEGYFAAMRIPLVRGRLFEESDGPDAPHVAVISESLARAKWPNQDPIGRFVQFGNMDGDLRGFRIVGIVGDVRELSPETLPGPIFYGYYRQRTALRASVVVRATAPAGLAATARQLVARIDPEMPLQIRTVDDAFDRALAGRRFSLMLIGVFSACALILATLGVYGLMSYLVAQRTREIGIRAALGSTPGRTIQLIARQGTVLIAVGVLVGLAGAYGVTRLLVSLLYGISPLDGVTWFAAVALLSAAGMAATLIPARRATKVNPVAAIRAAE